MHEQVTDPATEVAGLADWLLKIPSKAVLTSSVLSESLGVSDTTRQYLELMAAASARVDRLAELATRLNDQQLLPPDVAQEVDAATRRLSLVFSASGQSKRWDSLKEANVKFEDGFALFKLAMYVRPHRPLRVITEEERARAHQELDEAAAVLRGCEALDPWVREHLVEGLERLSLILTHFRFFGHAAAIQDVAALQRTIEAFKPRITAKEALAALGKTLRATVFVAELLALPHNVQEGFPFWQHVLTGSMSSAHDQKQLSGPALKSLPAPPQEQEPQTSPGSPPIDV